MQQNSINWLHNLPIILLSKINIIKDLGCKPTNLVFGTPLLLSEQFFEDDKHSTPVITVYTRTENQNFKITILTIDIQ